MQKPNITFVIHDIVGGVAYMNHQIIEYSNICDFFNVHIILFRSTESSQKQFTEKFKANDTVEFKFSNLDNYYFTLKRLHKLIEKYPGIVVTNDGIELEAIKAFGTKSVIYSIVHDFYNLRLAVKTFSMVDVFMCHTETFARTLRSSGRLQPRIDYLPHGVKIPPINKIVSNIDKPLQLLFIGRLVESKGVLLLKQIDSFLKNKCIEVIWTIIGSGELEEAMGKQWAGEHNVTFLKPTNNQEVMEIARNCDIFISPSTFEGYGIAVLEAMACGLAPIVNDLPIGIAAELPANVGFKITKGPLEFAEKIEVLNKDRVLLYSFKMNARSLAVKEYDIICTAKNYLKSFQNLPAKSNRSLIKEVSSFGFFDKRYWPNNISVFFKKIRKR